jgi:glutamine amidotransferase
MIVMVDSGGTNIASVGFALKRLGITAELTADKHKIQSADKVILPGVGTAREAMNKLNEYDLIDTLRDLTQPVLGICLGMQLLCAHSEEGDVNLLNIIDAPVKKFDTINNLPVPHMGWNDVTINDKNLKIILEQDNYFYFVHSYYVPIGAYTIGQTIYGHEFSSMIRKNNFWGCQFHPERSSKAGASLLKYFVEFA